MCIVNKYHGGGRRGLLDDHQTSHRRSNSVLDDKLAKLKIDVRKAISPIASPSIALGY